DEVEILSGVRFGKSLGSPIALLIRNLDWENWKEIMAVELAAKEVEAVIKPRPGHADLAGALKTGQRDIRNILERASARETVARVVVGAVAKALLSELSIKIISHVLSIGLVEAKLKKFPESDDLEAIDSSPVRCFDAKASELMVEEIEKAINDKDSLGGIFEVLAFGVPPGLGSYVSWDSRLDSAIAKALMSIPGIKGVEIGDGFGLAAKKGSQAHDEIFYSREKGFFHKTNQAGGIEGGVTNGEPVVVRAAMKPIPTLGSPLRTVDIRTKKETQAFKERADVCAVPSAAVVGETMLAIEIIRAILEKFGGDSLVELKRNYQAYLEGLRKF
ncbi:MAG: chorismate synthase, partial [Candidatus Subteraquimicrobiales bacterium]|nr:chorismate synthase [Candidatus Subteraquimicrobiales bacterium]